MSSDNLEKLNIETSDLLGDPELIVDGVDIPDNERPSPVSNDQEKDEVTVLLTHSNLPNDFPDTRFKLNLTIEEVKNKIMFKVGTPVEYQQLSLKNNGMIITEMDNNSSLLKEYNIMDGQEIHVTDNDPNSLSLDGGLTDVSQVSKYKMSDEDYNNRSGTLREHLKEEQYNGIVDKVEETMINMNKREENSEE